LDLIEIFIKEARVQTLAFFIVEKTDDLINILSVDGQSSDHS